MKRPLAASAAVVALLGTYGANAANEAPAVRLAEGKAVYEKWCAPCHADSPRLAGTLALQTKYEGKIPAALELRTDMTPETVSYFVRNGVAWMAPFRKTEVSDAQLAAIGAYLTAPLEQRGLGAEALAKAWAAQGARP